MEEVASLNREATASKVELYQINEAHRALKAAHEALQGEVCPILPLPPPPLSVCTTIGRKLRGTLWCASVRALGLCQRAQLVAAVGVGLADVAVAADGIHRALDALDALQHGPPRAPLRIPPWDGEIALAQWGKQRKGETKFADRTVGRGNESPLLARAVHAFCQGLSLPSSIHEQPAPASACSLLRRRRTAAHLPGAGPRGLHHGRCDRAGATAPRAAPDPGTRRPPRADSAGPPAGSG